MDGVGECKERIRSFLALEDNWDSNGAKRISETAVDTALKIFEVLETNEIVPPTPYVFPTTHGGVLFEWWGESFDADIEITEDGKLYVYFSKGETEFDASATVSEILKMFSE